MAQFTIRRLIYSDKALAPRATCIAVFLFDENDDPVNVLPCEEASLVRDRHPNADIAYLNAVLGELRGLRGTPRAIREFVTTRLSEASLSLTLEDPISIDESDANAARNRAAAFLVSAQASSPRRGTP